MNERFKTFEDLGVKIVGRNIGAPEAKQGRGRKKTLALAFETPDRETEQRVLLLLRAAIETKAVDIGHREPAVGRALSKLVEQVPHR